MYTQLVYEVDAQFLRPHFQFILLNVNIGINFFVEKLANKLQNSMRKEKEELSA